MHQFYFKLGKYAIETFEILKVDLEGQQWEGLELLCFSKLRSGVAPVENAECWGPPLMSTTDENVN